MQVHSRNGIPRVDEPRDSSRLMLDAHLNEIQDMLRVLIELHRRSQYRRPYQIPWLNTIVFATAAAMIAFQVGRFVGL